MCQGKARGVGEGGRRTAKSNFLSEPLSLGLPGFGVHGRRGQHGPTTCLSAAQAADRNVPSVCQSECCKSKTCRDLWTNWEVTKPKAPKTTPSIQQWHKCRLEVHRRHHGSLASKMADRERFTYLEYFFSCVTAAATTPTPAPSLHHDNDPVDHHYQCRHDLKSKGYCANTSSGNENYSYDYRCYRRRCPCSWCQHRH